MEGGAKARSTSTRLVDVVGGVTSVKQIDYNNGNERGVRARRGPNTENL